MPTTTFNIHGQTERDAIHLGIETSTGRYERAVTKTKIDTPEKLAAWLLAQPLPTKADDANFRRRLTATWHEEQVVSELGGELITTTVKVVDSVDTQVSAEEIAWESLLGSPLATVTVAQADAAVDGIANLAEAKVYLKRVNALVINLRDIEKRVLDTLRDAGIR